MSLRTAIARSLRSSSSRRVLGHAIRLASTSANTPERPGPSFPCVDAHAVRESRLLASTTVAATSTSSADESGPEPPYARPSPSSYKTYHHASPFALTYGSTLPSFDIAYETWGTLSPARDNVILLHTGLSASSHAASTPVNPAPGWWEAFIGPGRPLDTDKHFIICTNVLGGCYGSTGPSSVDPTTGKAYATTFPVLSIFDMVRAQFALLDHLGIEKLYASVGSSMGGMQSLAAGWLFPERVGKVVSISGTARSSPSSIAMRYAQRSGEGFSAPHSLGIQKLIFLPVLMADPNWNNGFYYDGLPPHAGMKLARRALFSFALSFPLFHLITFFFYIRGNEQRLPPSHTALVRNGTCALVVRCAPSQL
jgi:homoserine acetyltransferase